MQNENNNPQELPKTRIDIAIEKAKEILPILDDLDFYTIELTLSKTLELAKECFPIKTVF